MSTDPSADPSAGRSVPQVSDVTQTFEPPDQTTVFADPRPLAVLEAADITAWFGDHMVLDQVSLTMLANQVTALIGPSGCGKSTFLRILNRMHELVPSASLAGTVAIDGIDIYRSELRVTEIRRRIGMVFQKPNPFPTMTVAENVVSGLKLSGLKTTESLPDIVERCLRQAGL